MPLKCETSLLQDPAEFEEFLKFIEENSIKSYLEIGSKHGGSFWRIARSLPDRSRVVSVDLPHGDQSFKESEPHLKACIAELKSLGYDAHLILGDSTDLKIVDAVRNFAPFDLVFIDANHTEPYVRKDWENYGPMAKIVAFHDIGHIQLQHKSKKLPIEVSKVWSKLKKQYRHQEIRLCQASNGIGILWRPQIG